MKLICMILLCLSPISFAETYSVGVSDWKPFTDTSREDGGISIQLLRQALRSTRKRLKVLLG